MLLTGAIQYVPSVILMIYLIAAISIPLVGYTSWVLEYRFIPSTTEYVTPVKLVCVTKTAPCLYWYRAFEINFCSVFLEMKDGSQNLLILK